jgi:hypothetical protein
VFRLDALPRLSQLHDHLEQLGSQQRVGAEPPCRADDSSLPLGALSGGETRLQRGDQALTQLLILDELLAERRDCANRVVERSSCIFP